MADAAGSHIEDVLAAADLALVVCVTVHPRPPDRSMPRSELRGVQTFLDGEWIPHPELSRAGDAGMNSMARLPDGGGWVCCTGGELLWFHAASRRTVALDVPGLDEAHDLLVDGDSVYIANTAADEHVVVSLPDRAVVTRARLPRRARGLVGWMPDLPAGALIHTRDRFHLNQVFRGADGDLWAVVHNVDGRQVLYAKLGEVLKAHGNGGVINLRTNRAVELGLSSPHTLRIAGERYVLFDSGRAEGCVYSFDWQEVGRFPTLAWGRGADVDEDAGLLAVGISPIRKRYAGRIPVLVADVSPAVEILDLRSFRSLGSLPVPRCEQVYGVHLLPRAAAIEFTGSVDTLSGPQTRP